MTKLTTIVGHSFTPYFFKFFLFNVVSHYALRTQESAHFKTVL